MYLAYALIYSPNFSSPIAFTCIAIVCQNFPIYSICIPYAISLSRILISDLVVADLLMHLFSGMILLYLAASFYTEGVLHEITNYMMYTTEVIRRKLTINSMQTYYNKLPFHSIASSYCTDIFIARLPVYTVGSGVHMYNYVLPR